MLIYTQICDIIVSNIPAKQPYADTGCRGVVIKPPTAYFTNMV